MSFFGALFGSIQRVSTCAFAYRIRMSGELFPDHGIQPLRTSRGEKSSGSRVVSFSDRSWCRADVDPTAGVVARVLLHPSTRILASLHLRFEVFWAVCATVRSLLCSSAPLLILRMRPSDQSSFDGSAHNVKASSTTSEFTKRKNWSQHIIDEIQVSPTAPSTLFQPSRARSSSETQSVTGIADSDALSPCRISCMCSPRPARSCSAPPPSASSPAGPPRKQWGNRFQISSVRASPPPARLHSAHHIPTPDADDIEGFSRDFQNSLRDGNDLTLYYRFRMKDDRYIIFEITGHPNYAEVNGQLQCKCFFAMGRPYPSKNTAMLDSFLELKIENERLRQELHDMYTDMESGGDGTGQGGRGSPVDYGPPSNIDYSAPHRSFSTCACTDPTRRVIGNSRRSSNPYQAGLQQSQYDRSPQMGGGSSVLAHGPANTSASHGALGIGISNTGNKGDMSQGSEKKKKVRHSLSFCAVLR